MKSTPDFSLGLTMNEATGQILSISDPELGFPIFEEAPAPSLLLNGLPLLTEVVSTGGNRGDHVILLKGRMEIGYGSAVDLSIRRMVARGNTGLRAGVNNSVHIRYEITRVPCTTPGEQLDYIWQPPLEAPFTLDTVTLLNGARAWFGLETRMRSLAIGGSGPREHVSYEDGPVNQVVPYLQTPFRTEFPGQITTPGALYYHPGDERWVWVLVRRPHITGRTLFQNDRLSYRFSYHRHFALQDEVFTPAVTLIWGRGLDAAEKALADQFDLYEAPPAWMERTTWFWLHPAWTPDGDYTSALEGAKILMDECGVNGFGLMTHDVPLCGYDIDVGSLAPMPSLGGTDGLKALIGEIKGRGGHTYAWTTRHAHRPDCVDYKDSWRIKGVDGRPIRLRSATNAGCTLDIINPADPDFEAYTKRWLEYYVREMGLDGLFWDSGYQALPSDFGDKDYLVCPGETNALAARFYDRILRYGKSLSPDFFMWAEGISTEISMNLYSVDGKSHGEHSGHRFMQRIAHLGRKRLYWRSHFKHDLASGFVMLNPMSDIGFTAESYRKMAVDPMNQWVCRIVAERGVHKATGLDEGVSRLDEFVVVAPTAATTVTIPDAPGSTLTHVITGEVVKGAEVDGGIRFDLADGGYTFG